MKYRQDLQVALRNRYARLVQAPFQTYPTEVRMIREWIAGQPALAAIADAAVAACPTPAFAEWLEQCVGMRNLSWPGDERSRAALVWQLMNQVAQDPASTGDLGWKLSGHDNYDDGNRFLTQSIYQHLFDYFAEELGTDSEMLHLLERYKRQLEWFDRDALYESYAADTQRGEASYDKHLRSFLFSQGVDYPFSQARGASGDSDVVASLETDDPLVCEIKLFGAAGNEKGPVAAGVNQVVQYGHDYGKTVGYLVVIDLSGHGVQFASDADSKMWPARIEVAGVTVHLVAVRALPTATASKLGKASPTVFSREDLTAASEG
jgi:hypothetical protein